MKILSFSTSCIIGEWFNGSLASLNEHEIATVAYDKIGAPPDRAMLNFADALKPDLILYVATAGGPFLPSVGTFARLKNIAPVVNICFDAGDVGFRPLLEAYAEAKCFSLVVACDGCNDGPVDLVSFHPVDPRPYAFNVPLEHRPIALGTCGGFPPGFRGSVKDHLMKHAGLVMKPREEKVGSYQRYADFMMRCRVVFDCAVSAGGEHGQGPFARTLKTRAIETGLAGACLLELRGCALNKWAEENRDYMTYETAEEGVDKAHYLADNVDVAKIMAANLHKIVTERMSPRVFYDQVMRLALPR